MESDFFITIPRKPKLPRPRTFCQMTQGENVFFYALRPTRSSREAEEGDLLILLRLHSRITEWTSLFFFFANVDVCEFMVEKMETFARESYKPYLHAPLALAWHLISALRFTLYTCPKPLRKRALKALYGALESRCQK